MNHSGLSEVLGINPRQNIHTILKELTFYSGQHLLIFLIVLC